MRNRLVEHYMRAFVPRIAERVRATLPRHVDLDDLMQQGCLGLVESIERFDPVRGTRFETFSSRRVAGSMRDWLRCQDTVPRLTRARARRVRGVVDAFQVIHGRAPDVDELRARLDVPDPQFRRMHADATPRQTLALGAIHESSFQEGPDAACLVDRSSPVPPDEAQRAELRRVICRGLDERDRLILVLYFYEGMTMREIGSVAGCSESRVSQCLASLLDRIRARLRGVPGMVREFQIGS